MGSQESPQRRVESNKHRKEKLTRNNLNVCVRAWCFQPRIVNSIKLSNGPLSLWLPHNCKNNSSQMNAGNLFSLLSCHGMASPHHPLLKAYSSSPNWFSISLQEVQISAEVSCLPSELSAFNTSGLRGHTTFYLIVNNMSSLLTINKQGLGICLFCPPPQSPTKVSKEPTTVPKQATGRQLKRT